MWGWIGAITGGAAAIAIAIFAAPAAATVTAGSLIVAGVTGTGTGAFVGHFSVRLMNTREKELAIQDKQLAQQIQAAKTDELRVQIAQAALARENNLFNTLTSQINKNNNEMEEIQQILRGEKVCPPDKTLREVQNDYQKREQENSSLVEQIKRSQATTALLQQVVQSPSSYSVPTLTFKNIGLWLSVIVIALIVLRIIIQSIVKGTKRLFKF